jgi:hypothetical protein
MLVPDIFWLQLPDLSTILIALVGLKWAIAIPLVFVILYLNDYFQD